MELHPLVGGVEADCRSRWDVLESHVRDALGFLRSHPKTTVALSCAGVAVAGVAMVPAMLGFGAGGIASGSIAAGMMSSAAAANGGAVAAGSTVAVLQSVGAAGAAASTYAAAGVGAAAVGAGTTAGVEKLTQSKKKPKQHAAEPPRAVLIPVAQPVDPARRCEPAEAASCRASVEAKENMEAASAPLDDSSTLVAPAGVLSDSSLSSSSHHSAGLCVMCLDRARDCYLGCPHLCLCTDCAAKVPLCPIGRCNITCRQTLIMS